MTTRSYSSPARERAAEQTRRRIIEEALRLFVAEPYDDVTLRRVAAAADVSLPTVVNHAGSKEELFAEAARLHAADASDLRGQSVPDDIAGAAALLMADYEQLGDVNWRLLTVADRVPVVADALEAGRLIHREWVERTFPAAYAGLTGAARERRIRLLMAATDALTWKLLRRDQGLTAEQTQAAIQEALEALYCLAGARS